MKTLRTLVATIAASLISVSLYAADVTLPFVNAEGHSTDLVIYNTTSHPISVPDFYRPFPPPNPFIGGGSLVRLSVVVDGLATYRYKGWPDIKDADPKNPAPPVGRGTFDVPYGLVAAVEINDGNSVLRLSALQPITKASQAFGLLVGNDYRAYLAVVGDGTYTFYRGSTKIGEAITVSGFYITEAPIGADRVVVRPVVISGSTNPSTFVYHRRQSGRYELTLPITNFTEAP